MLRGTEIYRAAEMVSRHFTTEWLTKHMTSMNAPGQGRRLNATAAADLITEILRCINNQRLGEAEGSLARHPSGSTARRYYSEKLGRLQWLTTEPPTDGPVVLDACDEFPDDSKWEIVYSAPWKIRD